ncbi:hypothetical protein Tco_1129502, partial [Tanacetum coccineum]
MGSMGGMASFKRWWLSWWGGGDRGVAAAVVEAKDGDGGCDDGVLWMTMVERGGWNDGDGGVRMWR